jgi:hypothetical protein
MGQLSAPFIANCLVWFKNLATQFNWGVIEVIDAPAIRQFVDWRFLTERLIRAQISCAAQLQIANQLRVNAVFI